MTGHLALGLLIAAIFCALPALALRRRRKSYLLGVFASIVASVILSMLTSADARTTNLLMVVASPLVEESTRILFLLVLLWSATQQIDNQRSGFAFGVGFGGLELCIKWLDLTAAAPMHPIVLFYAISSPVVPFIMHIGLSLAALVVHRRGVGAIPIWFALVIIHIAHNASAIALDSHLPLAAALLVMAVRLLVYGWLVWKLMRQR